MGEILAPLIPVVALMIPIAAIIARTITKMIALKEKQLEVQTGEAAEKAAQYAAHNERLEQRVRVLERIITDRGQELSTEIEKLRDAPLN
jgi:hypothetical protein